MIIATKQSLSVLLIEDNPGDRRLAEIALQEGSLEARLSCEVSSVGTLADARALLSGSLSPFDAILLDLGLPDTTGLNGLTSLGRACPDIPIIVLTGNSDLAAGTEALKQGAADYLDKADLLPRPLLRTIQYAIERKQHEVELLRLAQTDPLTGLLNRRTMLTRMSDAIASSRDSQTGCAICLFDIDHFKEINDVYGHRIGDNLLKQIASALSAELGSDYTLARLGGDEFAVVATELESAESVPKIASRVIAVIESISVDGDARVAASASVGGASDFTGDISTEELLAQADLAMYKAKVSRRGSFSLFDDAMNAEAQQANEMLRNMPSDIEDDRFFLEFQPILDAQTHEIVAVEGLARWRDRSGQMISPADFIPIAEKFDILPRLAAKLLDDACSLIRAWSDAGVPVVPVSLNISPVQCRDPLFGLLVLAALTKHQVRPHLLKVEITESTIMNNLDQTRANLELLRSRGVGVHIDDFGTGYSSLSLLRDLPFDTLKIDRSFICNLEQDADAGAIVEAIIAMAKRLGFHIIAEGVETESQMELLTKLGVDALQGFYFSKSVSSQRLAELLLEQQASQSPRKLATRSA
ncbi:EAL domain-containing protein [Parasphingorhabdus sp.]|uniref:EAL domain-containing protein n=1 Tax=Parasphingorhabdus sp. TaxID=2709688 RepID=UPI003A9481A2